MRWPTKTLRVQKKNCNQHSMQHYNKLVRDGVPEHITRMGEPFSVHIADEQEYWQKLKEKLREEVDEFIATEQLDELADLYEVIDAIIAYKQISVEEIQKIQAEKRVKRGSFLKRIILEWS